MFTFIRTAATVAALGAAAVVTAAPFDVRYESEAAGLQHTTATFSTGGVETFETVPLGTGKSFSTDFGTAGKITGRYSNVQVNPADQYGGAGGTGNYAVTFTAQGDYSLDLSSTIHGGVNYFGFWLSALDAGNDVTFYSQGRKLFTFNPADVVTAVNSHADPRSYYGNPNPAFAGQDSGEPFVFLDFFSKDRPFDKVVFSELGYRGGYESDNHTVGHFLTEGTGTSVPLSPGSSAGAVPEPGTWAMMLAGFGLIGATVRRRRMAVVAA